MMIFFARNYKHTSGLGKLCYIFVQAYLLSLMLTLTACGESGKQAEKLEGTSYLGVNKRDEKLGKANLLAINSTDKDIFSITVNGEGGIDRVNAKWVGVEGCCVSLPLKWHPGTKVTIEWQVGHWLLDKHGKEVLRDGEAVLVRSPYKTRTVEVPKYTGGRKYEGGGNGTLDIYFYANDEVKVLLDYGYPLTDVIILFLKNFLNNIKNS